jgi:hypothetical protein
MFLLSDMFTPSAAAQRWSKHRKEQKYYKKRKNYDCDSGKGANHITLIERIFDATRYLWLVQEKYHWALVALILDQNSSSPASFLIWFPKSIMSLA